MRLLLPLLIAPLVVGCAATASPPASAPEADPAAPARPAAPADPGSGKDKKLGDAVIAPLTDLNLIRAPIPPVLGAARQAPYATPADLSCEGLGSEIERLDAALGADLDTASTADAPTLFEKGATLATDAMIGAVRSTTEGVIPFRGWVRRLSGAERYSRDTAAAIAAGTVRRAYLKGLGQASGCLAPAAPAHAAGPQPE